MATFELYFASLVSFTLHPGYQKPGTYKPSLTELAAIADEMVLHTEQRTWQSQQQQ